METLCSCQSHEGKISRGQQLRSTKQPESQSSGQRPGAQGVALGKPPAKDAVQELRSYGEHCGLIGVEGEGLCVVRWERGRILLEYIEVGNSDIKTPLPSCFVVCKERWGPTVGRKAQVGLLDPGRNRQTQGGGEEFSRPCFGGRRAWQPCEVLVGGKLGPVATATGGWSWVFGRA